MLENRLLRIATWHTLTDGNKRNKSSVIHRYRQTGGVEEKSVIQPKTTKR